MPRLKHPQRFVRARACCAIKEASETQYSNQKILSKVVSGLCERLVDAGEELPVKVEAAIAIQHLLSDQEAKGTLFDVITKKICKASPIPPFLSSHLWWC